LRLRAAIRGLAHHPRHGPLPALLVVLTVSTGIIDATTFLALDRVFVANMTGNVVFMAFALGGASEFSVPASLTALIAFLAGAQLGGQLHRRLRANRGRRLAIACAIEAALAASALAISLWAQWRGVEIAATATRYAMIALLGITMGLQNATIQTLGVPGLTTTVLTGILTGIAADAGGPSAPQGARLRPLGVVVLFIGAAIGALLVLGRDASAGLGAALTLLAGTAVAAERLSRRAPAWTAS
jgi:uncharacterized membrane protein YoaK (UPF0700 family)